MPFGTLIDEGREERGWRGRKVVHAALAYPSYNLAHPPEIQKALSPSDTLSRLRIPLAVWPLLSGHTLSPLLVASLRSLGSPQSLVRLRGLDACRSQRGSDMSGCQEAPRLITLSTTVIQGFDR